MIRPVHAFLLPTLCAAAVAQNTGYVFSTSQTETTASGSGGTVLQTLRPNEVAAVEFFPCPVISAEKWSPRTCYNTMAGDDDADGAYDNAAMFGSIDALCDVLSPVLCPTPRSVYWSPSVAMFTNISGAPGLRPGDTARIVRNGSGDGQVEHFLTAEQVQTALGMPVSPVVVDVDAICADPSFGIFLSLDQTHAVNCTCGTVIVQDGDLIAIPPGAITWTLDLRVAAVVPGSAVVCYTEAQMDLMVASSGIKNRFGACLTQIQDLEALDIDYSGPVTSAGQCTTGFVTTPALVFSGELMTGCGLCTTAGGGQIWTGGCGPMGAQCGTVFATLGNQLGLQPTSAVVGVASYVSAFSLSHPSRFTLEPQLHTVTLPTAISVDLYTPVFPTIVFAAIVPPTVAPSLGLFPNCYFPDIYILPWAWSSAFVGPGFTSVTTPVIPSGPPAKAVFQAAALNTAGQVILSTPASVDIN